MGVNFTLTHFRQGRPIWSHSGKHDSTSTSQLLGRASDVRVAFDPVAIFEKMTVPDAPAHPRHRIRLAWVGVADFEQGLISMSGARQNLDPFGDIRRPPARRLLSRLRGGCLA